MRLLTALVLCSCAAMLALVLLGCRTTSLRSPVAKAAEFQNPVVTAPVDETCGKPVYQPPLTTVESHQVVECKDGVCTPQPRRYGLLPIEPLTGPVTRAKTTNEFPWWMAAGGLASVLLLIGYLKFKP